jgi:sugar lactone lactonase YvrE
VDNAGIIYVTDFANHILRTVTPAGVVAILAGQPGVAGTNEGMGSAARFNSPSGVAVDSAGNVYVADELNQTLRKVTPAGLVTTLAGLAGDSGESDGTGSGARFAYPSAVAVDPWGTVYVADYWSSRIRKVTPKGVVTTVATRLTFDCLATDGEGNLYVGGNGTILRVTPAGALDILAGFPDSPGSSDGTGLSARLNGPTGMAVDAAGILYVVDSNMIKMGFPVSAAAVPRLWPMSLPAGEIGFGLSGPSGATMDVEFSTDMSAWETVDSCFLQGGTNVFGGMIHPQADGFYRAHLR